MTKYGYKQQWNGKWMVVSKEGMSFACVSSWYGCELTKEEAIELARIYCHGEEPTDFTGVYC